MAEGGAEETREQLEARHEGEEEDLEERARAHLEAVKAGSGKGKKAKAAVEAAERDVEQWRYDLGERHREELEALEARGGGGGGGGGGGEATEATEAAREEAIAGAAKETAAVVAEEDEAERAQRKKDKAARKRQGRSQKEAAREAELERERREAGPSRRQLELDAVAAQLAAHRPPLKVLEVLGDGHCLYRSVADQIRRFRPDLHSWARGPEHAHDEVRALCAAALRRGRDGYEPFAELAEGEDFAGYCDRVERSADWGGQLELRALADSLGVRILVHRAEEKEPLALGEDSSPGGDPLRVTYHRYWYALGEHYNSAVLRDGGEA